MDGARTGEKYFAPTHVVRGYIGRVPRFMVRRWLLVGRWRMGGARAGEKYSAPTVVVLLIGMGGDCVTANGWRTDG